MANIKSAKKRIKVTKRNRARNLKNMKMVRDFLKQARKGINDGAENVQELVNRAVKWLDRTAQKRIITKNAASRKKSRLMKLLSKSRKK